jgi:hypothetical protein
VEAWRDAVLPAAVVMQQALQVDTCQRAADIGCIGAQLCMPPQCALALPSAACSCTEHLVRGRWRSWPHHS